MTQTTSAGRDVKRRLLCSEAARAAPPSHRRSENVWRPAPRPCPRLGVYLRGKTIQVNLCGHGLPTPNSSGNIPLKHSSLILKTSFDMNIKLFHQFNYEIKTLVSKRQDDAAADASRYRTVMWVCSRREEQTWAGESWWLDTDWKATITFCWDLGSLNVTVEGFGEAWWEKLLDKCFWMCMLIDC